MKAFLPLPYTNLSEVTPPVPQAAACSVVEAAQAADDQVVPALVVTPVVDSVVEGVAPVAVVAPLIVAA